ncbi:MAG: hypothetical protein ACOYXA_17675 [Bacteroidota bacterium]
MRLPKISFAVDWPNHIIGFFSALFGILIAFELDQWRESRKEAEIAANAFDKLKQEIQINKNSLHESTSLNLQLLGVLEETVLPLLSEDLHFEGEASEVSAHNADANFIRVAHIEEVPMKGGRYMVHIGFGNFIRPVLHYSAWESAKATGALNFMAYEKVLSLSSLYNAPQITDELLHIKQWLEQTDQVKTRTQLNELLVRLRQAHRILEDELQEYDLFVNMLEQIE